MSLHGGAICQFRRGKDFAISVSESSMSGLDYEDKRGTALDSEEENIGAVAVSNKEGQVETDQFGLRLDRKTRRG